MPGYDLLGILGHGGMGVVYRARQLKADRIVALKMLRAVEHATPHDRIRFQIETEAVARLQHPNIVQLHEVGEVRGQPFFSLEFCEGGALDKHLKTWRPTPQEAAELIETLARAMHYAHLRGVVHRDLKPANVLLSFSRERSASAGSALAERSRLNEVLPKITDFGLAKRLDAEGRDISQSGAIMGTPSYMAPEQAAGKVHDTGPAADVYALGALLYKCLTNRPPFDAASTLETLHRVLHDEPVPPSRLVPKVPHDLEVICLKCLCKEPVQRYADAEALADDLRRYLLNRPVMARAPTLWYRTRKFVWRNRMAVSIAAVLLTLCGAVFVSVMRMRQAASDLSEAKKKETTLQMNHDATLEMNTVYQSAQEWRDLTVEILFVGDWLTELSAAFPPKAVRAGLLLNSQERYSLRKAMLEDVMAKVEKAKPLQLDSKTPIIALLKEAAVHGDVAAFYAEFDRAAQGVPHLERVLEIQLYLMSADTSVSKSLIHTTTVRTRINLLDLREQAGVIENPDTELAEMERLLKENGQIDQRFLNLQQAQAAITGIRGALLGRRGDFAGGEQLLLARHAALWAEAPGPASLPAFLPNERLTSVRRLVNLYTAWGRPDEAAKWESKLPRKLAPPSRADGPRLPAGPPPP